MQSFKILIILLIVALIVVLTLTAISVLNPIFFWVLAGLSAILAFKVIPKMEQS